MTAYRDIVYFGADADEDEDGWTVVSLEIWPRGAGSVTVELSPDQAEEMAEVLLEAVGEARRRCGE